MNTQKIKELGEPVQSFICSEFRWHFFSQLVVIDPMLFFKIFLLGKKARVSSFIKNKGSEIIL